MTQTHPHRFVFSCVFAAALLAFTLAAPVNAQEAKPTPAISREVVKETSAKAQTEASPAKAAAEQSGDAAKGEETAKPRELTPAEKEAAIAQADEIAGFDPANIRGMARPWQIYFQPAASPVMEQLEWLHNYIMVFITIMTVLVMGLLLYICIRFRASKNPSPRRFAHNTTVEIVWTVIPIVILTAIGIPSVRAHYQYTNNQTIIDNPDLTLKVVGHQWYWSYEYPDQGVAFDSNIVPEDKLPPGRPRLLTVDNPVVLPVGKVVRIQMTSADVIHDWAVPAFGLKNDTVPGRLSESWVKIEHAGIYYGQCSELCGKYHGFMPIEIHAVSPEQFEAWLAGAKLKFANDNHMQLSLN